jgi:hypothetical protein
LISGIEQWSGYVFRFLLLHFRFQRFRGRALFVEDEQSGKDIIPDLLRPPEAVPLAAWATVFVFVPFILELRDEFAAGSDIGPTISVQNGTIHGVVQLTESWNLCALGFRVVEPTVDCGEALVPTLHYVGTEFVVCSADFLERRVVLESFRERKRFKAI